MTTRRVGGGLPSRVLGTGRLRGGSIDAVFEGLYRRLGARYADASMAFVLATSLLFVVPVCGCLLFSFWHPSLGQYVRCVLAYDIVFGLVAGPATFILARRVAPATYRWISGRHARADAPAAWASTVAGLPRWVAATGLWYALWCVPPTLYVGATLHFSWYGYPIYLISLGGLISVVLVFYFLLFEQAFRPVAREIAAQLPQQFEPPGGLTLGIKALVLIPAINFFSAVAVASLTQKRLGPELYLGEVALLAVVVSLTLSLVLTLLFRNSVVRRIEDLRGAIRRVDAGDLGTRVAPLAGDELDDIGASFNEMVAGLRERETLREHNAELVVDLRRQADELRDSRARIVAASDAARRRVEQDLHDGAQQRLVLLRLKLGLAKRHLERDPRAAAAAIEDLREDLDTALAELRDLAHGIYPAVLENQGLPAALSDAAERSAIPTEIESDGIARYPTEVETAVYFCCLEALQNAAKHAGRGAHARVTLADHGNRLAFEVSDNGHGFDPGGAAIMSTTTGIQNMIDRIGALGGTLLVDTTLGNGTKITGVVPLIFVARHRTSPADGARRPCGPS